MSGPTICKKFPSNCSKSTSTSTSTSHDHSYILQTLYPILESININTSDLDNKSVDVIYLQNLASEVCCVLKDNNINMNLEKWVGRGNKELIRILSVGHLKYDEFKQNVKQDNFIEKNIKSIIL